MINMTEFTQTKEHYDLISAFDKEFKGENLTKENESMWRKSIIYQNGATNKLFLAYRSGYMLGKIDMLG